MFIAVGFVGIVSSRKGKPSRMRKHVTKMHPTVHLELDDRVWRSQFETVREVPACFPTPPGYVPYGEEEIELPFQYIPMPKELCPKATELQQSPVPLTSTVASSTPQDEASDWEDVGMDILIEEEVADDGPPVLTLQWVVSVKPVVDEVPVEVPGDSRTVQCAAMNLLATAGFQDVTLEDEPQQDPVACLQTLTKRVRAALGDDTPSPVPPEEGPLKKPKMSVNFAAARSSPSSPALLPSSTPPAPVLPSPPPAVPVPKNTVLVQIPHTLPLPPTPVFTPPTLSTGPALLPSPSVTPAPEQTIGVCSVPSPPTFTGFHPSCWCPRGSSRP